MNKKVLSNVLPWVLLILAIVFLVVTLTWITPIKTVATGSMEPTLPVNSRILIDRDANYKPGEIITFHADEGELVTHRLVKYAENGDLVTKGDANTTQDYWNEPVTKSDVVGKVIFMTPVTTVEFWTSSDFWRSPKGIGFIACMLLILVMAMWNVDVKKED